jgi:hypothetical protein
MRWFVLLLVCLAVAGCAPSDNNSDDHRFGGFYGGVNGGVAP